MKLLVLTLFAASFVGAQTINTSGIAMYSGDVTLTLTPITLAGAIDPQLVFGQIQTRDPATVGFTITIQYAESVGTYSGILQTMVITLNRVERGLPTYFTVTMPSANLRTMTVSERKVAASFGAM